MQILWLRWESRFWMGSDQPVITGSDPLGAPQYATLDEETLEPTYRLQLGAPGKSAGLEIATRLGMPAHIMDKARQSLGVTLHQGRFMLTYPATRCGGAFSM